MCNLLMLIRITKINRKKTSIYRSSTVFVYSYAHYNCYYFRHYAQIIHNKSTSSFDLLLRTTLEIQIVCTLITYISFMDLLMSTKRVCAFANYFLTSDGKYLEISKRIIQFRIFSKGMIFHEFFYFSNLRKVVV